MAEFKEQEIELLDLYEALHEEVMDELRGKRTVVNMDSIAIRAHNVAIVKYVEERLKRFKQEKPNATRNKTNKAQKKSNKTSTKQLGLT